MNRTFTFLLVVLFGALSLKAGDSPTHSISRLLDANRPADEQVKAIESLLTTPEGAALLQLTASQRAGDLAAVLASMFENESSRTRRLVLDTIVNAESKESYLRIRNQALNDESSEVRAQALGAAVLFGDRNQVVTTAVVKELNSAKTGPALSAAAQVAQKYALDEAITPLVVLLTAERFEVRAIAASSLASYPELPKSIQLEIEKALQDSQKEITRMETIYALLPSAKNPEGSNAAEAYRENLTRALQMAHGE